MPQAGKYGRQPPHPMATHPRVILDAHTNWDDAIASVPAKVDDAADVGTWPMYLNDQLSDCGEAGWGHSTQAITTAAGQAITPTNADVESLYGTQGYVPGQPSTDRGTVLQDLLMNVLAKQPWPPGTGFQIKAVAQLRNINAAALRACLYYFRTVYVGGVITANDEDDFNAGQPWTLHPGAQAAGSHCFVLEKVAPGLDSLTWITWGARQRSSIAWWFGAYEEAWVPVTQQAIDNPPPGVDTAGVMAEYASLT